MDHQPIWVKTRTLSPLAKTWYADHSGQARVVGADIRTRIEDYKRLMWRVPSIGDDDDGCDRD